MYLLRCLPGGWVAVSKRGNVMPADPTPTPPAGKPRRRPAPGVGGNLVWVIILVLLFVWFVASQFGPPVTLDWGEFYTLVTLEEDAIKKQDDSARNLERVVFQGTTRILGEIRDVCKLPEETADLKRIKEKFRNKGTKFAVERLRVNDDQQIVNRLNTLATKGLKLEQQEDSLAWLGTF